MNLLDIYNLALSALGEDSMADVDEVSRGGDLCRLHYPHTRDTILASAPWPSVRKFFRLARVSARTEPWGEDGPAPGYAYAYSVPADLQHPYHLVSYGEFDYSLGASGRQFSCNEEAPILFYNANNVDIAQWELGLSHAVLNALSMAMARPLTGSSSIVREKFDLATLAISQARAVAQNSAGNSNDWIPDWLAVRGGATAAAPARFIFPFVDLKLPAVA